MITFSQYKIIEAYGLKTRTWGIMDGKYGCAECCNRDRCDDDCDAPYYRPDCPHCKGKGWIPEVEVTIKPINEGK